MREFELYESVRIKASGETGVIVSFGDEMIFVEKNDEYKTGDFDKDVVWVKPEEIELI